MEIGIGLPSAIPGTEGTQILEWARRAEAFEFSTLGSLDRLVYENYEPLVSFAAVAAVTSRIRLTTSVLLAPLRTNAALLAKQAATVQAISDGRLTLGLGLGGREDDYTASGLSQTGRGATVIRQVKEMRAVWRGAPRGFAGGIGPSISDREPDVLLGGTTALALSRAARYADGWIMGGGPPQQFADLSRQFDQAWADAARDKSPRKVSLTRFALGPSAREDADSYLQHFYAWLGDGAKQIAAGTAVDAESIRSRVAAFGAAGCEELIFFPSSASLEQIELLAEALR